MEETRKRKRYFKDLSRREYIERAYQIIKNEGEKAVSIRRMAKEFECSTTSLYRYFDNVEELIYYAYLIYLDEYLRELSRQEKEWKDIWDTHIGIWEGYSRIAFSHPKAFNIIFFSQTSRKLTNALPEFYEMFPERLTIVSPYLQVFFHSSDLFARDMEMVKRCEEAGVISHENGIRLNRMVCLLYKGYLKDILDKDVDQIGEAEVEARVSEFRRDVETIVGSLASDLLGHPYSCKKES